MSMNGILPGGPYVQAPFPQVGQVRNNFYVGKVSDEDQLKNDKLNPSLIN